MIQIGMTDDLMGFEVVGVIPYRNRGLRTGKLLTAHGGTSSSDTLPGLFR